MEVLISMFVLAVGLLGLAALIPVGRFAIVETGKSDRAGACGRAGMRNVKVRRMLEPYPWMNPNDGTPIAQWVSADGSDAVAAALGAGSFAIDPVYVAATKSSPDLGPMPRVSLRLPPSVSPNSVPLPLGLAEEVFNWHDDLLFEFPEDREDLKGIGTGHRPVTPEMDGLLAEPDPPRPQGHYSWFVTVTPAVGELPLPVSEKRVYLVSVVVCYRRDLTPEGEHIAAVEFFGSGFGGGSLKLTFFEEDVKLRENEWIMLCGPAHCKWYRMVSVGAVDPTNKAIRLVSLTGPDWDVGTAPNPTAVVIDSVVGVYSTTVVLDRDPLWTK